jgi:hypothetical protein
VLTVGTLLLSRHPQPGTDPDDPTAEADDLLSAREVVVHTRPAEQRVAIPMGRNNSRTEGTGSSGSPAYQSERE